MVATTILTSSQKKRAGWTLSLGSDGAEALSRLPEGLQIKSLASPTDRPLPPRVKKDQTGGNIEPPVPGVGGSPIISLDRPRLESTPEKKARDPSRISELARPVQRDIVDTRLQAGMGRQL